MEHSAIVCPACQAELFIPSPSYSMKTNIDGFIIEQYLGRGNVGEVYQAIHAKSGTIVALKLMIDNPTHEEEDRERFKREARMLRKLKHGNIISCLATGVYFGGSYIAMTYVEGYSLQDLIKKQGKVSERFALYVCYVIADALEYAWNEHKVIHRDLKPDNIMTLKAAQKADRKVYLMDLGLAKSMLSGVQITVCGDSLGTPYYMSPEQIRTPQSIDYRSDIYSLGATLYHMCCGTPPYAGLSIAETITRKMTSPPTDIREFGQQTSKRTRDLIKQMMRKNPGNRLQNWSDVKQYIKTI